MAKKKGASSFREFSMLGSISAQLILTNLPFVLFLGFLTTIYIANTHFAERKVRQIQSLQQEIKDLRRQYNALESEIMLDSKLSEVGDNVGDMGLKKTSKGLRKIVIEN